MKSLGFKRLSHMQILIQDSIYYPSVYLSDCLSIYIFIYLLMYLYNYFSIYLIYIPNNLLC
jgi:hypothetical protein